MTVATALITVSQRSNEAAEKTSELVIKDMTAEKLASVINSVYANGSKLKRNENDYLSIRIKLPESIHGENYTLSLNQENRMIIVENSEGGLKDPIGKASIIPKNINGFVLGPENLSNKIRIFWDNKKMKVKSC